MKAIVLDGFGGPEVLKAGEAEAPVAGPGRILIRVRATSVNRPDIVQRQGNYPPPPGESPLLGLEAAGTVEALGPGVSEFERGERVFALLGGGGYAELAVAHAGHVMRIPDNLSFERLFGKMIALQDMMAEITANSGNRTINRVVQGAATMIFLPI